MVQMHILVCNPFAGIVRWQGTVPVAIDTAEGVFAVLTVALGGH